MDEAAAVHTGRYLQDQFQIPDTWKRWIFIHAFQDDSKIWNFLHINRVKTEIGATKRKKIRTVDFCDTLAAILKTAKAEQHKNCFRYGELYSLNYYSEVKEKDRTYYEVYSLPRTEEVPEGYIAR